MSELLILGVGPHAIEMLDIVSRINSVRPTWTVIGFVSLGDGRVGETLCGFPIMAWAHVMDRHPEAFLIAEFEWPNKTDLPLERLASLIDPSAFVSGTARIGRGCVIYPHCYVGSNACIGDFLFCLAGSIINHNDIIEDRVTLTAGVTIAGDVHVEADCYLGQSCTVRQMLRIGRGSLIGMGCVVLDDVAPNSVMVGNPGRRLKARERNYPGKGLVRRARHAFGKVWAIRRNAMALQVQSPQIGHAPGD